MSDFLVVMKSDLKDTLLSHVFESSNNLIKKSLNFIISASKFAKLFNQPDFFVIHNDSLELVDFLVKLVLSFVTPLTAG